MSENIIELKGIDEIPMFSWNTKTKEFYILGHKFDGINSIEDFINYIHNLDKEKQQLKENLKATNKGLRKVILKRKKWKDKYYNERYKNKKLESVLKEIREYIYKSLINVGRNEDCFEYYLETTDIEKLLEIIDKGIAE